MVIWEGIYRPFGEAEVNPHSSVVNNFRFPGQYYDQETGFHYNYFRYYAPNTGSYLRADPIAISGVNHLYAYVRNNPINFIDELGLRESQYCPGGKWDVDVHGGLNITLFIGGSRSRVTLTCLSNKRKCAGVLDWGLIGLGWDLSIVWSFEIKGEKGKTIGTGTVISGYHTEESIEDYFSSSGYITAGFVGTSGNNIEIGIGSSLFAGKQYCITRHIVCDECTAE